MLDEAAGTSDWKLLCDMVRLMGIYTGCESGKGFVGYGAVVLGYQHLIQRQLLRLQLVDSYDWFIVVRADYLHLCSFDSIESLDKRKVYVPEGERFGGYSDRFMLIPAQHVIQVLNVTSAFLGEWELVFDNLLKDASPRRVYNVEIIHMLYFLRIRLPITRFHQTAFAVRRAFGEISSDYEGKRLQLDNFTDSFHLLVKFKMEYKQARRACPTSALSDLHKLAAKGSKVKS